jgi:hypothetical protein
MIKIIASLLLMLQSPIFPARGSSSGGVAPLFGLVDGWAMNEGSGTSFVDSNITNAYNLTIDGAAGSWGTVSGFPGTVFTFSGSTGATNGSATNASMDGAHPFSLCGWFRTTGTGGAIISTLNAPITFQGYFLGLDAGTTKLRFGLLDASSNQLAIDSTSAVSSSVVHQGCATYDGSNTPGGVVLYVDGSSVAMTTTNTGFSGTSVSAVISTGAVRGTTGSYQNPFTGTIGWTSVWSCVLTSGVISTNNAAGPSFTGLHC